MLMKIKAWFHHVASSYGAEIIKIFFITSLVSMYLHFHSCNIYEKAELFIYTSIIKRTTLNKRRYKSANKEYRYPQGTIKVRGLQQQHIDRCTKEISFLISGIS